MPLHRVRLAAVAILECPSVSYNYARHQRRASPGQTVATELIASGGPSAASGRALGGPGRVFAGQTVTSWQADGDVLAGGVTDLAI